MTGVWTGRGALLGLWAWVVGVGTLPGVPALAGEGRFIQVGSANEEAQLEAIDRQLRKELEKRKAAEAAAKAEAEAEAKAKAQAKAKAEAEAKAKAQAKAKAEAQARAEAEQARVAEERAQSEKRAAEERAQAEKRAAEERARAEAEAKRRRLVDELEAQMVAIKGGCFEMGSSHWEQDHQSDERQHEVCVGDFRMGKYEFTQGQWQAVMGSNPSGFSACGDNCPVESVSWLDVQNFIERLNAKTGKRYRLPTETEWEYACRGGRSGETYCGGNQVDAVAWHAGNHGGKTHPVGQKQANGYGLHDMSGNVREWTCSEYKANYDGSEKVCNNRADDAQRVIRGGSWGSAPAGVRSAYRFRFSPVSRTSYLGFRLAQGEAE